MDYERYYGEPDGEAYHSDSAIPGRRRDASDLEALHAQSGLRQRKGMAAAASSSKRPGGAGAVSTMAGAGPGAGRKDRTTLRAAGAAREKKARKKNIARKQRDEAEIRMFRGTVSTVCTCMELDTEKLLPALQKHFDQSSNQAPSSARSQPRGHTPVADRTITGKDCSLHIGDDRPDHGVGLRGPSGRWPVRERGVASGASEDEGEEKPVQTIKGSWTLKMYVDVLHAESTTFAKDDMVKAAKAELQNIQRGKSEDLPLWNDEHAGDKLARAPTSVIADVKHLVTHMAAAQAARGAVHAGTDGEAWSPAPKTTGEEERRHRTRQTPAPEDDVGEATGEDSEVDLHHRRGRGRGTGGRTRSLVQEESEALSDVDGFLAHAPASGEVAPIYVDEDGYEPDARNFGKFGMYEPDPEHALAPDEAYLSTDPLLEEFEASIQAAAATVSDLATKHVFCFQYGCLVFWGLEAEEEQSFIDFVHAFEEETIEEAEHERDDMTFFYAPAGTAQATRLYNDQISLSSNSPLEKLAVSFSLAQSTKLMVLESRVENTFEQTRTYPQQLAEAGEISLSQTDVSKLIGQLFIVKSSVNLESDMLSIPDFFWDNEIWEPIYRHACKYLEIDERVVVVNKRLEVLDGMFQMLKDQLEVRHATRLEWIVIWLIVAEVGLQVVWNIFIKDILGFFHD